MSLRVKLVALFAAVLAATMGLASWLGGRIAQASIAPIRRAAAAPS